MVKTPCHASYSLDSGVGLPYKVLCAMKPAMRLSTTLRQSALPAKAMTDRLVSHYGLDVAMALLAADTQTIYAWQAGRPPTGPNYRLLWLIHAMTFEPHKLGSMFHILTWGRFAQRNQAGPGQPTNEQGAN